MVSITKREAKKMGLTESEICDFHLHNPDQVAIQDCCPNCQIISDPCGCDADMSCTECVDKIELMSDEELVRYATEIATNRDFVELDKVNAEMNRRQKLKQTLNFEDEMKKLEKEETK